LVSGNFLKTSSLQVIALRMKRFYISHVHDVDSLFIAMWRRKCESGEVNIDCLMDFVRRGTAERLYMTLLTPPPRWPQLRHVLRHLILKLCARSTAADSVQFCRRHVFLVTPLGRVLRRQLFSG
jgi:hypothetical protein